MRAWRGQVVKGEPRENAMAHSTPFALLTSAGFRVHMMAAAGAAAVVTRCHIGRDYPLVFVCSMLVWR